MTTLAPVSDNQNVKTGGSRGPLLVQDRQLFLFDGLVPFQPGERDTVIPVQPESGLLAWRRGSSGDPEKHIPVTNWTE